MNIVKICGIIMFGIFSSMYEHVDVPCFNADQYYLFIILLFGLITIIFMKYDPREKVDFKTEFNKGKIISIALSFILIYYLLKSIFIIASLLMLEYYC